MLGKITNFPLILSVWKKNNKHIHHFLCDFCCFVLLIRIFLCNFAALSRSGILLNYYLVYFYVIIYTLMKLRPFRILLTTHCVLSTMTSAHLFPSWSEGSGRRNVMLRQRRLSLFSNSNFSAFPNYIRSRLTTWVSRCTRCQAKSRSCSQDRGRECTAEASYLSVGWECHCPWEGKNCYSRA